MTKKTVYWSWCGKCPIEKKIEIQTDEKVSTKDEIKKMFMDTHGYTAFPTRCPKCQGK